MIDANNQLAALKDSVKRAYLGYPWYREKMDEAGIKPEDIASLEDIRYLPFMTKDDLRKGYPWGVTAVDVVDVIRIHCSSGTTGKPTVVSYTQGDIDKWAELMAWCLRVAGLRKDDIFQISYNYGLFTGSFGYHYGAERIGCCVIPASGGYTERQIELMMDLGTTAITSTPSYALYLAEVLAEKGISPDQLKLRLGIFGGEPWSEEMRVQIERGLGLVALDCYGLSEIWGPGVAIECSYKDGLHIREDYFIMEVIDPETLKPIPMGEEGELVITTLNREATPMIRYRTRDITRLFYKSCACGLSGLKMDRVKGRTDDMLIIRGVNVFPKQIESILGGFSELSLNYQLVVGEKKHLKRLEVRCELSNGFMGDVDELTQRVSKTLKDKLGVTVDLVILPPGSLERSSGKAKRLISG
ncbi:MAG: phenylacetate--CoA ligase [Synergistetes bacterium]|nr:phenylacetate--CoA ligase [Synergistota bacterium]MCX8127123.1 phenylacetate--CoA ligase [Synergistota bacterium]MDW8191990.1 phenylacetate--CoA ligase [Synergistota bacterium]